MRFTTIAVSPEALSIPGGTTVAEIGSIAVLWILVHGAIAATLFAATLFTFDRCLGRISRSR
jgi:hypothetical protein